MRDKRTPVASGLLLVLVCAACGGPDASPSTRVHAGEAAPAFSLSVRFVELDGGVLQVREDPGAHVLAEYGPTDKGFLRGLVPALAQDRRLRRTESAAPYVLTWNRERAPVLIDPVSEVEVDLSAFGPGALEFFNSLMQGRSEREETS